MTNCKKTIHIQTYCLRVFYHGVLVISVIVFLLNKSCHTNVFTPIVQIAESQSVEDNGQAFQQVRFVLMLFVSVVHCFVCILLFL